MTRRIKSIAIIAAHAAALSALAFCAPALAQDYPTKSIRFVVPLTPGSGADIAGRIIAKHLGEALKQTVIVENRPGAGGQIGTQAVVKSDPDGYTLLVQSASHAANPAIYKSLPYDPLKDLIDVAILGVTPYVMVTAKGGAYPTLKSLIDAARAKPGDIPFASAGVGSSTHLAAEYFAQIAGVKMLHIPFKGSPEAIQDTIAGRTSFYMAPINTAIGQLKDGRLAALGVSTRRRADVLAEVPPLAEHGLAGFDISLWFGMWAPAGTPDALLQKLNAQVNAIVQMPQVKKQFADLGIEPSPMQAEEFAKFVREQISTYQKIVKQANIQPQ
ncbi:MAG: tripartite tricarboxylate transporter substrate binding protein [Betaproteobacteria bacterium]|nr:tripartite tricarboxylate transporter substrate binding protein [Betaproteobacteria bacterium]